jgi:primary-amine oxidase
VVKSPRSFTEPETLVLTAKFGVGNYQYVHRWEFRADGAIHPQVGLAGELYPGDKSRPHVHNFYYRLDLDILSHGNNVVEKFEHRSQAGGLATDRWIPIPTESAHRFEPDKFTRWRVRHRTESNANSRPRSYEIIPGSDGGPDGHFSTADFWLVDRRVGAELGDEVLCTDRILTTSYATGAPPQPFDSVVWVCLRVHHHPRESGEETKVVPYHFSGFHIEPRDFLDATPTALYSTDPASP